MASDTRDRQLGNPHLDQALPVRLQGLNEIPQRGEWLVECPALDQLLSVTRGPDWGADTRINEFGHGTFREDDALLQGIAAGLRLLRGRNG